MPETRTTRCMSGRRWRSRASGRSAFCAHLDAVDSGRRRPSGSWPALAPLGVRVGRARSRAAPGGPRCPRCSAASRGRCASSTRSGSAIRRRPRRRPPARALPDVGFKLDAARHGRRRSGARGHGRCRDVDFKGQYGIEVEDEAALRRCTSAWSRRSRRRSSRTRTTSRPSSQCSRRTPAASPTTRRSLAVESTTTRSTRSRRQRQAVPDRRPAELCSPVRALRGRGIQMYGGGMGELGVARGQIQLLASLFHPDAPNDVAPARSTRSIRLRGCLRARCPRHRRQRASAGRASAERSRRACWSSARLRRAPRRRSCAGRDADRGRERSSRPR